MTASPKTEVASTLHRRVQTQLSQMAPYFSHAKVKVEGAKVELSGHVETAYEKELAEFLVGQISDVRSVENRLTVMRPFSGTKGPADDLTHF